ncbi:hypothetical protein [Achromobacter anxifer]|uniref:hypothetical protein n=1 Tax=Achromobacter anxifer TaxID=1287737 RepID=UPI001FE2E441|nr:hypothetical protein [Achromobacter anxifer]
MSLQTVPAEPYAPRRMAFIDHWREDGLAIKAYAIQRNPDPAVALLSDEVVAAARRTAMTGLQDSARDPRATGLGFCIVHVGEEAVWLLVDWWISGGILCQRMYSAPLGQPEQFQPVQGPFIACVWELEVTAHERRAWMRHVLREDPDTAAYLADVMPAGSY